MNQYVTTTDGNIERTYRAPSVENLPLASISLKGGGTRQRTLLTIALGDGLRVNGERVHPFDLIRFCDGVLETFTGEELTRARAL